MLHWSRDRSSWRHCFKAVYMYTHNCTACRDTFVHDLSRSMLNWRKSKEVGNWLLILNFCLLMVVKEATISVTSALPSPKNFIFFLHWRLHVPLFTDSHLTIVYKVVNYWQWHGVPTFTYVVLTFIICLFCEFDTVRLLIWVEKQLSVAESCFWVCIRHSGYACFFFTFIWFSCVFVVSRSSQPL